MDTPQLTDRVRVLPDAPNAQPWTIIEFLRDDGGRYAVLRRYIRTSGDDLRVPLDTLRPSRAARYRWVTRYPAPERS